MAEYFRSQNWKKLTEVDIPRIADSLGQIAKQMEESNIREKRKFAIEEKILLTTLKNEKFKLNEQQKSSISK